MPACANDFAFCPSSQQSCRPSQGITEFGKPYSPDGFGNRFRAWCAQADLPHCSAHGLRKAGATFAAENGATEHQLMAIYGWKSAKMSAVYTRKARQKKLAGSAMGFTSFEDDTDETETQ